ncbi:MAG: anti-sigma factor family protein [Longimicrobiales bacterium]
MSTITCDAVRDRLPDYVLDRLGPGEASLMEAHVRACAGCRAERDLVGALRTAPVMVPDGLHDRVMSAIRNRPARRWSASQLAMAATVVFAFASAGVISQTGLLQGPSPTLEIPVTVPVLDWTAGEPVLLRGGLDLDILSEDELVKLLEEMDS